MLKIKKFFSSFVGMAMAANALITMPFSAFADEESSRTYTYDGYEVSYDVTNSWGNTEVVSVTLSNTGDSAIENWMLYFDPNGQVHDPVNAQKEQTSVGTTYFKNSGYNANVNPDSSVSFSYMVDDCEAIPDDFTLCQTRTAKESGYQVSLQVNQTWGDSFNGEIIIQNNTDQPIEAWELTVDTNFTITEITNSWAATVTELEPYSYMLKGTYTGTVYANSSVSLGFNGVKSGDPVVTDYSLTEVVVDEGLFESSELNNNTMIDDLYRNDKVYAEALYDSENENINISWNATASGISFEVYISDNNKDYELYETVDGNTFNSAYHITDEFLIKYIKIKQTLDDENIIYSNICYVVYAPVGVEWTEYQRKWDIPNSDELLSEINTEGNPYDLSLEFDAAGVPDIHLNVSESFYSNAIGNDYILGTTPEINYKDDLAISDITVKFQISDNYLENELGTLEGDSEFENIKRFNLFKYFEGINMLLPIETKFDLSNNTIYTNVEELGTYCIVDMEKWLESLDVDDDMINKLSANSAAGYSLLYNDTENEIDTFISSEETIGEDASGSLAVMSTGDQIYNNIQLPLSDNVTLSEAAEVNEVPVDIVFVWQSAGELPDAYEVQKQMLLEASGNIFTTYPNARIYVIGFKHNEAYFLKNDNSDVNYFSSRAEMNCLKNYEHEKHDEGYVNRSPAYEMVKNDVTFRDGAKKFVFTIFNGSTDCQDTDQIQICNDLDINYSEVMARGTIYLTSERAVDVLNAVVESNGICIMGDENSARIIYEHICDNMELEIPDDHEDKVYMGMDWNELTLSSPLQINGSTDSDNDGLTDWEEVNSDFLEKNGIILNDNEYITKEQIPSAWYMLKSKYNCVPFRYVNSNNSEIFNILNEIKVLPVNSNPLRKSSADDGINDFDKLKPECIFDNYKSEYYDKNGKYYKYYDDKDYYYEHLEDRYKQKDAFKAYTVESLFPEFKEEIVNSESNAVYIKVDGNEISICPNIYFTGDYDGNVSEYLKIENNDSINIYENLVIKYGDNVTLDKAFIDGLENRWGNNEFAGTIFDFFPGMNIKTNVKANSYYEEPQGKHYLKVNIIATAGVSAASVRGTTGNSEMGIYIGQSLDDNKGNHIDVFNGVCAHEFGHFLMLLDAYETMNGMLTSACHNDKMSELYYDSSKYGSAGGGEIMNRNSDVLPNDVEMMLYGIIENKMQYFTPTYKFYDGYNNELSKAIKEKPTYQYFPDNGQLEYDTIYKKGIDYIWIDEKGYIPLEADIKTYNFDDINLKYYEEANNETTTITIFGISNNEYNGTVIIPEKINDNIVIHISYGAFKDSSISPIIFEKPENIIGIGIGAFNNCVNLERIDIPNNVKCIFPHTFENCSNLKEITFSKNENNISDVAVIEMNAFKKCTNLKSLCIPSEIKKIEISALDECDSLESFTVDGNNENYSSENGILFNKDKTQLIKCPVKNNLTDYVIPSSVNIIDDSAFKDCDKITQITIPQGITKIGAYTFSGCTNLKNVSMLESVESIGIFAFWNCENMDNIEIPKSVKRIDDYAFYSCGSLSSVTLKKESPENYANNIFWASDSNLKIYVPNESIAFYEQWITTSTVSFYPITEE